MIKNKSGPFPNQAKRSCLLKPMVKWVKKTRAGESSLPGKDLGSAAGQERLKASQVDGRCAQLSGSLVFSSATLDGAGGAQISSEGSIDVESLAEERLNTGKPLGGLSKLLSLPSTSDFADDEAGLVSLNTGLAKLDVGGNACKSGGMPRLFHQEVSNKGHVVEFVCSCNNSLRAKLEKSSASGTGSLGVILAPCCSKWAFVAKRWK